MGSSLLPLLSFTHAIIAYDCGGTHLNTTTISLLTVGECDLKAEKPVTTDTYIQLLQLSTYGHAEIIQCKIEITRQIYHCGMHSHVSVVHNGQAEYLLEINRDKCLQMHKEGFIRIGASDVINGLKANGTHYRSIVVAGRIGIDGSCSGTQYSDHYGTWDSVVVQANVKISLRTGYVSIHLENGRVMLPSGTVCPLSDGNCLDGDDGYTFWQPLPPTTCRFDQYDVLYEGIATKMQGTVLPHLTTVFTLNAQDVTFALTQTRTHTLCGYTIFGTEHPKLFILETQKGNTFKGRKSVSIDNLDIFAYVNSKFVYVEKHIRLQMTNLYHDIMIQKCELERQVLQNTLSLATVLPDEFAYRLMKVPGHMAVVSGEVIHVLKCIPIEVTLRKTNTCHTELPVTYRNISFFITPKSRILTKHGTSRECNPLLPISYNIETTWVQFSPFPISSIKPQELKPLSQLTWKYLTPNSLATSGIYSEEDLQNLRNHIMFPAEKSAILNTVAQGFTGQMIHDDSVSLQNLLDEDTLNKIYTSTASRIWNGLVTFGSATAGIFGIFVIIRVAKLVFDTLIHGYALHSAYGCSIHLIGAVWSSITHLLLHLAQRPNSKHERVKQNTMNTEEPRATAGHIPTNEPSSSTHDATSIPVVYTFNQLRRMEDAPQIP